MKILKGPETVPEWSLVFTCLVCRAELKADFVDVEKRESMQRYHRVTCPVCGTARELTQVERDAYNKAEWFAKINKKFLEFKNK